MPTLRTTGESKTSTTLDILTFGHTADALLMPTRCLPLAIFFVTESPARNWPTTSSFIRASKVQPPPTNPESLTNWIAGPVAFGISMGTVEHPISEADRAKKAKTLIRAPNNV